MYFSVISFLANKVLKINCFQILRVKRIMDISLTKQIQTSFANKTLKTLYIL